MKVSFEESFGRDLRRIKDKKLRQRIKQVIENVKSASKLDDIKNLIKMKGYTTFYRIRLADYRIEIEALKDEVIFVRMLHRKDIYRYFP